VSEKNAKDVSANDSSNQANDKISEPASWPFTWYYGFGQSSGNDTYDYPKDNIHRLQPLSKTKATTAGNIPGLFSFQTVMLLTDGIYQNLRNYAGTSSVTSDVAWDLA
jgi:hypothetical protein